jgi:hypothetical protein
VEGGPCKAGTGPGCAFNCCSRASCDVWIQPDIAGHRRTRVNSTGHRRTSQDARGVGIQAHTGTRTNALTHARTHASAFTGGGQDPVQRLPVPGKLTAGQLWTSDHHNPRADSESEDAAVVGLGRPVRSGNRFTNWQLSLWRNLGLPQLDTRVSPCALRRHQIHWRVIGPRAGAASIESRRP